MTDQEKKIFTAKISAANAMGLIAIDYEILEVYIRDARLAFEAKNASDYKTAVKHCEKVIRHLIDRLDFNYELSNQLYSLYTYCLRQLATLSYKRDLDGLDETQRIMGELGKSFKTLAQADDSKTIMSNAQTITAGLTYGMNSVNEYVNETANRGYFA